jgi:hypothetical protein
MSGSGRAREAGLIMSGFVVSDRVRLSHFMLLLVRQGYVGLCRHSSGEIDIVRIRLG